MGQPGATREPTPFDAADCPVLQVVFASGDEESWRSGTQGLSARDIAMHVALPEVDGRLLSRAVSFKAEALRDERTQCAVVTYRPVADRVAFVAKLAASWARLRAAPAGERRVALVLANYPNRDGRIGNGVGLDTPAGTVEVLKALSAARYRVEGAPEDSAALMDALLNGVTNSRGGAKDCHPGAGASAPESGTQAHGPRQVNSPPLDVHGSRTTALKRGFRDDKISRASQSSVQLSLSAYTTFFATLPATLRDKITAQWGTPEKDPFYTDGAFLLPAHRFGNIVIGIQPARGYNIDPAATYHSPDLLPPHGYLAFYAWLRREFGAHAIVHMGKHGNLEWLPGKALALSADCAPEAALGPLPHLYPFIVNDPGEGSQAKRRAAAVIIDHLTPPLTRAESYGPLRDLEQLVDEYYEAAGTRSSALQDAARSHSGIGGVDRPRQGLRRGAGRQRRCGAGQAGQSSLRAEGTADPRRAACVRRFA